jgi:hypothetical protein
VDTARLSRPNRHGPVPESGLELSRHQWSNVANARAERR